MKHAPMQFAEYAKLPALSATALKQGARSMLHMRHAIIGGGVTESPAMRMGRLIHAAVLEPAVFAAQVAVWTGKRRYGSAFDEFAADVADTDYIVTRDEHARLLEISASVHGNPDAHRLIDRTEHEVTFTWTTDEYGPAKARLDMYHPRVGIGELKSTADAGPHNFGRTCARMSYPIQLGWYALAPDPYTLPLPDCHVIAVEQTPPYDCVVYHVPPQSVSDGAYRARDIARRYRECEACGVFPGVGIGVQQLDIPDWSINPTSAELIFGDETDKEE